MWIIENGISSSDLPTGCVAGDIVISSTDSTSFNKAHWSKKDRYTDDSSLNNFLNGYTGTLTGIRNDITNAATAASNAQTSANNASSAAATAQAAADALDYLKQAYSADNTLIDHGLILSTIVALRDSSNNVWSGISGAYDSTKLGNGIAAWYGGGMIDKEVSAVSNAAKSLFRFDGSGYVASGNLSWDANGNVTIQGYSINATTLQVGGSNVATQAMLDNFVSKAFFNRLFTAYDANGNAIVPNDTTTAISNLKLMVGTWTEEYLSALGKNSEGGGGGGDFDEAQMWTALQSTSGTYATTKIATSHIPDTASTYGYLKASSLNGYATQTWVNQQGFLTTHQTLYTLSIYGGTTKVLDFKPNANASIYIKAGGDISLTNDTTNKYITLSYTHPTNGANTTISAASGKVLSAITVNSLGHVTSVSSKTLASADIPDISATYATASRATTLEGYFTNGVAKTAAKLNTGTTTYTAWGQTYWSSGVPQSISGNMTSVGSITPSANGNALGTTSARFNIYGTGGNFSSNVSVGGTLGVTGATTLSSTLSVASGITLTTTKKIYFGDTSHYLELDSTGFHFSHGVYSDSFVSALGSNSSGGGGGDFDEDSMWAALDATNEVIGSAHIPNLAASKITSGTLAAARIPIATASAVGGIKVGTTLAISDGVLNQKSGIATAGTYRSVTVDTYGRVTAGTNPTTLSGYGVLDDADGRYYALYGGTNLNPSSSNSVNLNNLLSVGSYYCASDVDAEYVSNKPITSNLAFRVWVSATIGTNGNYLRQRFQSRSQVAIFERVVGIGSGTVQPSDWGNWYLVQNDLANYALASSLNNYLPLSGGTLTGSLHVATGYGISDATGNGLLVYKPATTWGGISSTQWGVGSTDSQGVIRSGNYNLLHYNSGTGTSSTILDTNNTNVVGGVGYINGNAITTVNVGERNTYIFNGGGYDSSSSVTVNDLAASCGSAVGMIYANTDNPMGKTGWFHVWSQTWGKGVITSWVSQIAIGTANKTGMYYRTTNNSSTIVGKAWTRVLDASNYNSYALPLTGGTLTGTTTFNNGCWVIAAYESNTISSKHWVANSYYNHTNTAVLTSLASMTNSLRFRWYNTYWCIGSIRGNSTNSIGFGIAVEDTTNNRLIDRFRVSWEGTASAVNLSSYNEVTATSDERKKNILGDTAFSVKDIADTRSILFEWKDNTGLEKKVHGGSIAQDWLGKADWALTLGDDGYYSLNYGALALCSAITIAREVVKHEDEITRLKKEVVKLRERVAELEERRV